MRHAQDAPGQPTPLAQALAGRLRGGPGLHVSGSVRYNGREQGEVDARHSFGLIGQRE